MATTLRRWRFKSPLVRLLLGIAIAALMVASLEIAARILHAILYAPPSRELKWFRIDKRLGWDRQPGFQGNIFGVWRSFDAKGLDSKDMAAVDQHPDWPRIVTIGDSRTFGFGVGRRENWCEGLRSRLEKVNLVNLGVHGYTSFQGRQELEAYAWKLKPALITVSFSYNDRRAIMTNDRPDSAERFATIWRVTATRRMLSHIYIARALAKIVGLPIGREMALENTRVDAWRSPEPAVDVRTMRPRVSLGDYRANLKAIIDAAEQHRVPVLLFTLRDSPRFIDSSVDAIIRPALQGQWQQAEMELAAREKSVQPDLLLARAELSRLYSQAGRQADADRLAQTAHPSFSLHGGALLISEDPYLAAMREVAQQTQTPLVDIGAAMALQPEVYTDSCHFDAAGNRLVAEMLAPEIQRLLAGQAAKN